MNRNKKYKCNSCGGQTRFITKTDCLYGGIEHTYAECEHCGYKATVYYTNAQIRKLMSKQRGNISRLDRAVNMKKLNKLVADLKRKVDEKNEPNGTAGTRKFS